MKEAEKSFTKKRDWLFFLSKNRKSSTHGNGKSSLKDKELRSCKKCGEAYSISGWSQMLYVCDKCGMHHPISAYERLHNLLDANTFSMLAKPSVVEDPLEFPEYNQKREVLTQKTGLQDAVATCTGKIGGHVCVVVVMDNRFFMGSMGSYVGEAVTQAIEHADVKQLPLIIFSSSGGARMQEGIFSLLQMAKTATAIEEFSRHGGLYISCLTHPTTGGVTASFASLGDIMLAEPEALIGFAGPRVIEQTIRKKLPKDFQKSEYLEEHGFLDQVVKRKDFRKILAQLLKLHQKKGDIHVSSRSGN